MEKQLDCVVYRAIYEAAQKLSSSQFVMRFAEGILPLCKVKKEKNQS